MSVSVILQVVRRFTKLLQTSTNASYLVPGWHSRFRCFYSNFPSLLLVNFTSGLHHRFWSSTSLLVFTIASGLQLHFWSSPSLLVFNFTSGFHHRFWSSTSLLVFNIVSGLQRVTPALVMMSSFRNPHVTLQKLFQGPF